MIIKIVLQFPLSYYFLPLNIELKTSPEQWLRHVCAEGSLMSAQQNWVTNGKGAKFDYRENFVRELNKKQCKINKECGS